MNTQQAISVVVADDHVFFRDGLVATLQKNPAYSVVGQAGTGEALIEQVTNHRPNLVITDIGMPNTNGIQATQQIKALYPETKVIALSMHNEEQVIIHMLQAGAMGYLEKNISRHELDAAIDSVVNHDQVYFPESTSMTMFRLLKRASMKPFPRPEILFSPREMEVIDLVCKDYSSKEIADQLHLSNRTIESHRNNIMEKMNVKSVAGLVAFAYTNGLVGHE
jgi:DNA-binding NarL/FixJ family response regulator